VVTANDNDINNMFDVTKKYGNDVDIYVEHNVVDGAEV